MKKKFLRIFASNCVKYLLAFSFVFAISVLVFFIAKDTIKDYILEQTRIQLQEGVQSIGESTKKMQLISQMMYQDEDFSTIRNQSGNYSQKNLLQLRNCYSQLDSISNVGHYSPYMFALFDKNDFFLSNLQCSNSFSTYYSEFVSIAVPGVNLSDAAQVRTYLLESYNQGRYFIRPESFMFTSGTRQYLEEPILYLTNGSVSLNSKDHVFCFVLNKELLLDTILTEEFIQEGFLFIQDLSSGNELLSHGQVPQEIRTASAYSDEIRNYHVIEIVQKDLNWRITMGISASYISAQILPVQNTLFACLVLGIAVVLLLTVYFSLVRYYGFRQVLRSIPEEEIVHPDLKHMNDYKLLTTNMTKLSAQNQAYRTQADVLKLQNRAIMLEYFIKKGENTPQERQAFAEYLGKVPEAYCVVLMRIYRSDTETDGDIAVLEMIEILNENGVMLRGNVHSGISDELFLIELPSAQEEESSKLLAVFEELARMISAKYGCALHIGISSASTDLAVISKCYGQAKRIIQSLYMSENENIVQVYGESDSLRENPITLDLLNHLYTTLICGRYEEACEELDRIQEFYKRMPYLYETCREQIFYSLKNLFHTVVLYLNCEDFAGSIPVYTESIGCSEIITAYKKYAAWICDYIARNKKSHNEELKERILAIIHKQYRDCELSAYTVSKEVGITENYLSKFLKEQTGESFTTYLLRVRINKAREYLEQTDYSNEEIAALTGFASVNTFYRNFRKIVGISPKTYKENLQ